MNQITDFFRNLSIFDTKKESLFLFYDAYRVNSMYGFIAPGAIADYIHLIEADTFDSAIYNFVMKYYTTKIDWNLLDHQKVRDSYKHIFPDNSCPSLHDWIHESIEGNTIQTKSLVPFMKQYFINNSDQSVCISVQEIKPIQSD